MTSQAINIELPEDIYQRLTDVAAGTHRPFREVLVQTIRGNLPPTLADLPPERRDLVADLQMLSDDALWAVAKEELPAPQWRQHQRLLQPPIRFLRQARKIWMVVGLHPPLE